MIKKVFVLFSLFAVSMSAFAQSTRSHWVDSVFTAMDVNDKVGQLFMVPVSANIDAQAINEIENRIKSHEIGGLIFRDIGPVQQVNLLNHFQSLSDVPLMVAQEAELSTLLDSTIVFPSTVVLGAITNDTLLYQLGALMARQLKLIGVDIVFNPNTKVSEPVIDPNPINNSFGQDKIRVTQKSLALMRGLQDHGTIACARYFPMRSLTVLNVRDDIPALNATPDSIQRYPYNSLIAQGLKGIAPSTAAEEVSIDVNSPVKETNYSSSTLATLYTGDYLRRNMNFSGLTFIDVRKIETTEDKEKDGDAELFAFETGNDVLMYSRDVGPAIRKIKKALKKDDNLENRLDATVRKILEAKFDAGLWEKRKLSADNLLRKLNHPEVRLLNQKLYEAAITVVRNESDVVPVRTLEDKRFAYVSGLADEKSNAFFSYLKKYVHFTQHTLEDRDDQKDLAKELLNTDVIVVGVFPETKQETLDRLSRVVEKLKTKPYIIVCDFGHPSFLAKSHQYNAVITAYSSEAEAVKAVPQVLFGALPGRGRLPYSPSVNFKAGTGVMTPSLSRLAYSVPEEVSMDSYVLQQIDAIAEEAMRIQATPGCQVLVARRGKIVYEKSFGHLTYDTTMKVMPETLYDLASITKVAATLQTGMFMYERGLIDLNKKVSFYLPELKRTNKKDITMLDMLTHQSGLVPFIPMYPQTIKDTTFLPQYYSRIKNDKYPYQVADNLYASQTLKDSVWQWVLKSKMTEKASRTPYTYKYSDLGFLILQRVAEKLMNQPIDEFLAQNLYEPLGAYTLGFTPLTRFNKQVIAPTEDDKIYRRTFVSGTVHDERAAMMGGVAGHAGLFGNATDLGKFGQMLLQEGYYGGTRYYKPETVRVFTAKKFRTSRRGIGWDKPVQSDTNSPTSLYASPATFGHTGFTGTCIWIDPQFDLVYIFLSNRVYPDRNNKLSNANIRSRIQDVIYKSIFSYINQEKPVYTASDFTINAESPRP